jgi:hypothetical protein
MSASNEAVAQAPHRSPLDEWRRLIVVLLLVMSPTLVAGGLLEFLAWRTGETVPMPLISTWQENAPDRMWRGGDGHSYLGYRLARIADRKPEIIALGSSRANSIRGDLVKPYTFYNAGLTAWTFDQYRRFLDLVSRDGYKPRALVFSLDYWMFSAGFDHYWVDRFDEQPTTHVSEVLRLIGQLREDPLRLWRVLPASDRRQGLLALLSGEGFDADGVLSAAPTTPDPRRLLEDGTRAGIPPVELSEQLAPEQIAKFEQFAAFAKAKGVALIGVQLPYYAKILDGLNGDPRAGSWREFEGAEWRQRLAAAGVVFFDFADLPEYRDRAEYCVDSLDPDTRLAGEVMRRVMADPRVRALLPKAEKSERSERR